MITVVKQGNCSKKADTRFLLALRSRLQASGTATQDSLK